ncbi:GNAT family N-acetyltransferase [Leptolyngbya sp. FACHB-36]|uniref:GNAT family N-acetyltransferase n=1 Tax=Leptolyngbya sp. FACHB-36 TaxID=2692808 RepID=UPI0016801591|nr:GNAT family N-acetyltransferase [Leptolyngbya sp. FACHB-36]
MSQAPDLLITNRLILRRPSLADAAAIFEFACDPVVTRYMDWHTHTGIHDAVEFLEGCAPRWESGDEFCWAITAKPEDHAIGTIACRVEGHMADFGYVLNRRYWGQGYATEAVSTVVSWVMSLPEIYRVWATCDTENVASARVLEKTGLLCEGTLRCAMIRPNLSSAPRDTFIFAKVRDAT